MTLFSMYCGQVRKIHVYIITSIFSSLLFIYLIIINQQSNATPTEILLQQYRLWKYGNETKYISSLEDKFIDDVVFNRTSIDYFINQNHISSGKRQSFNIYHYKFDLINKLEEKCDRNTEILDLVFLVLSFIERRKFRDAIRQTWGGEDRFRVRTVFLMGIDSGNASVREQILRENEVYQDIVLADFEDTYHNNSIKYIMGLDWAVRFCSHSKFYILADDDAYFNVRKLLKYLASQLVPNDQIKNYPEMYADFQNEELSKSVTKRKLRFFGGAVFNTATPQRTGKFAINKQEFPYKKYLPFVNGHATIMSRDVIDELLEAAKHTKFMWLDDVYFGFLVGWAGIPITNIPEITYHYPPKEKEDTIFDKCISTHYVPSPEELIRVWNIQKARRNA